MSEQNVLDQRFRFNGSRVVAVVVVVVVVDQAVVVTEFFCHLVTQL